MERPGSDAQEKTIFNQELVQVYALKLSEFIQSAWSDLYENNRDEIKAQISSILASYLTSDYVKDIKEQRYEIANFLFELLNYSIKKTSFESLPEFEEGSVGRLPEYSKQVGIDIPKVFLNLEEDGTLKAFMAVTTLSVKRNTFAEPMNNPLTGNPPYYVEGMEIIGQKRKADFRTLLTTCYTAIMNNFVSIYGHSIKRPIVQNTFYIDDGTSIAGAQNFPVYMNRLITPTAAIFLPLCTQYAIDNDIEINTQDNNYQLHVHITTSTSWLRQFMNLVMTSATASGAINSAVDPPHKVFARLSSYNELEEMINRE